MKMISWGIIFVIVIFSFSFVNRVILNDKMEIMKEEVKYNNALELATGDATSELKAQMNTIEGTYNESQEMMLTVAKRFFDSFSMGFGYYGGNSKESIIKMYVPALAMMTYDGFYMYTLDYVKDNVGNQYLEHTLKPEIKYSYNDGMSKINFTLDNTVVLDEKIKIIDYSDPVMKPKDPEPYIDEFGNIQYVSTGYEQLTDGHGNLLYDSKDTNTGKVVDLNHYYDIEIRTDSSWEEKIGDNTFTFYKDGAICYTSNEGQLDSEGNPIPLENAVVYEKSFYMLNGQRYLLEEWRKKSTDDLIEQRMTEYTDDQLIFSQAIEVANSVYGSSRRDEHYYTGVDQTGATTTGKYYTWEVTDYVEQGEYSYLTRGNSENEGFINPLTGEYEIGEFHKVRREKITEQIKENLEYYILLHNKFAQNNSITYTFTMPEIKDTDWENAITDMSVFAFVQGIPMVSGEYYNNYGIAGAKVIDKELYYGLPAETSGIVAGELPTYYSNRQIGSAKTYLFERNNARIFDNPKDAADYGYYPNIDGSLTEVEELEKEVWDIKIDKTYLGCLTNGGRVYIPIEIDGDVRVQQMKWEVDTTEKNRYYFSNAGNELTNYVFDADTNKTYATLEINNFNTSNRSIVFTIFVRDVEGNTAVEGTGSIRVLQNDFYFVERTYPSYTNPNNSITMSGTIPNRSISAGNLMLDGNNEPMIYYTLGHKNGYELEGYYDTLKAGNVVSNVELTNVTNNGIGSIYSFSNIPGQYTVFGWDCSGVFNSINIDSTGAFVFTHNKNELYNASGNIITGAGTVTKARIYAQSNRRKEDIDVIKYIKGEKTLAEMRTISGATNINKDTYNTTDSTFYFEVTENAWYTVYAKDINGEERSFKVNMIGIGSDRIKITMTWTNGPDLDFHLKGYDEGGNSFHVSYQNKTHTYNGETIANMPNGDITKNNGLEIVVLSKPAGGIYTFYVTHYSGNNIGASGAVLKIYRGEEGSEQLIQTLNVPTGAYKYWRICTYDADTRNLTIYEGSSALTDTEPN